MLKKVFHTASAVVDDIFLVTGFSLISIGVFRIYTPAGYITTGICFLALAYFFAKRR